jgi:hypothetical protein
VKLTVDSSEPLEDAMRVLGALYGVTLVVANPDGDAGASTDSYANRSSNSEAKSKAGPAKRKRAASGRSRATRARQSSAGQPAGSQSPSNAEIRAWARQNGFTVSDRGRLPASVLTAFRQA